MTRGARLFWAVGLAFGLAITSGLLSGCSSMSSLSANAGYNLQTEQITAGVTIVFKDVPPAEVADALKSIGGTTADRRVWQVPKWDYRSYDYSWGMQKALQAGGLVTRATP